MKGRRTLQLAKVLAPSQGCPLQAEIPAINPVEPSENHRDRGFSFVGKVSEVHPDLAGGTVNEMRRGNILR